MDEQSRFHFRIKVGDVEVEASGPEAYVMEVRAYAEQLVSSSLVRTKTMGAVTPVQDVYWTADAASPSSHTSVSTGHPLGKEESLVEFLERLPSRTHKDMILAFGYFLEKNRTIPNFGVKEINDCYDEVKEAKSNTAQYLALLLKSGLIMKAKVQNGGATQYTLTRKGEKSINEVIRIGQQL